MEQEAPAATEASRVPLFFDFSFGVESNPKFQAQVQIQNGRILAELEEDGWAFYGVQPSGVTGFGIQPVHAFDNFKVMLARLVAAFAKDARNFEAFENRASKFFGQLNASTLTDWDQLVREVRRGTIQVPLEKRESAGSGFGFQISRDTNFNGLNSPTQVAEAVA